MQNRSRLAATTERVCQAFYPGTFVIEPKQVDQMLTELTQRKQDLKNIMTEQKRNNYNQLKDWKVDEYHTLAVYQQYVAREQTIYTVMNMAHHNGPTSTHLVWIPAFKEARFH